MPGAIRITRCYDAPFGIWAALTTSGGTWPTASYVLWLIAWDDPLEQDWTRARFQNALVHGAPNAFGVINNTISYIDLTTGAGDNDIVTLYWTAPRRKPHHYTLYFVSGKSISGIDGTEVWQKIRPSSGITQALEIPDWATSAVFANVTPVTESRMAIIRTISGNAYYEIEGNHAFPLYGGASYTTVAVGAQVTNGAPVGRFVSNEERTRVNESTAAIGQTYLKYNHGAFGNAWNYILGSDFEVTLNPVTGMVAQTRQIYDTDFAGQSILLAYMTNGDLETIVFECTHGALSLNSTYYTQTDSASALALLDKHRRLGIPLSMWYLEPGGGTTSIYGPVIYYGVLEDNNERGYTNIQANQRIQFRFKVTSIEYQSSDHAGYVIVTATSGTGLGGGSIVIGGDHTAEFISGTKIMIIGSTANDGVYAVHSSQITGSTSTQVFISGTLPDGTDDGFVRIWDQP